MPYFNSINSFQFNTSSPAPQHAQPSWTFPQPSTAAPLIFGSPHKNDAPKQCPRGFPQTSVAPCDNYGSAQECQMENSKANRKRSSSKDEDCDFGNAVHHSFDTATQAPAKRRRGLSDATMFTVNAATTNNYYWGKHP